MNVANMASTIEDKADSENGRLNDKRIEFCSAFAQDCFARYRRIVRLNLKL